MVHRLWILIYTCFTLRKIWNSHTGKAFFRFLELIPSSFNFIYNQSKNVNLKQLIVHRAWHQPEHHHEKKYQGQKLKIARWLFRQRLSQQILSPKEKPQKVHRRVTYPRNVHSQLWTTLGAEPGTELGSLKKDWNSTCQHEQGRHTNQWCDKYHEEYKASFS